MPLTCRSHMNYLQIILIFPLNFHNLDSIFSFPGRIQDFLKIFYFCKYFSESNTISKNLTESAN